MKELTKQEMKLKEAYHHPLNYFDEAKLLKVVTSRQKLPASLSWGLSCIICRKISKFLDFYHPGYIENNPWLCGDMKFLFECSTRYLTSEHRERVRYRVEHKKRTFISPSNHVLFCLFYKYVLTKFLTISQRFPTIF